MYVYVILSIKFSGRTSCVLETSRRENFPRRISGNPGNFPSGKFPSENFGKSGKLPVGKISVCVLYNNILYFYIKTLPKRVLHTQHYIKNTKSFSQGVSPVFSQNGRKLSPGNFPTKFPGKMSRHFLSGKFSCKNFLRKHFATNFTNV